MGLTSADGLINQYYDNGHRKIVKMDYENDANFFQHLISKEILETGWIDMNTTIAIVIQYYIYNQNLKMSAEKRIVIEFLE